MGKHSQETIEKIRKSQLGRVFSAESRLKMRNAHLGKKLSPSHREKVIKTLAPIRKGGTYEEAFGSKVAFAMKEKMRQAKLGKKQPWNSTRDRKGPKGSRWLKDRSKVKLDTERGGPLHKQWSSDVKLRDGWKCCLADGTCKGKVVAHHIKSWREFIELRYTINNGITLCHAHHPRKRAEEKELEQLFTNLVQLKES